VNALPEPRIERELSKLSPVAVPYNLRRHFPLKDLGQRRLELLLYVLFRRGITAGAYKKEFDQVRLLAPVEGLGRVLLLHYKKQVAGAVLSCSMPGPLDQKNAERILLAFSALLQAQNPRWGNPALQLFLAVPGGIDPALAERVRDWPDSWPGSSENPDPEVLSPLRQLSLEWLLPEHLDPLLAAEPDLVSLFFAVEMVAPEQALRRILGEFRVEELDPEEAAALAAKINGALPPAMNAAGLIRFFGYPREFLRKLVQDAALREIMIKGAEFKAELDYAVLDFLHHKSLLLAKVLLATAPVSPHAPARFAVVPFVFSRMVIKYLKNSNSAVLREIARSGARRDFFEEANLDLIRAELLSLAMDLAGEGEEEPLAAEGPERVRLAALRQAALECPDPEQLALRFADDWEALQPSIRTMEKKLLAFLPRDPVLVLDDFSSLKEDQGKAGRLLDKIRLRFPRQGPGGR